MNKIFKNIQGQGLIETLIAIFIIMMGLVATIEVARTSLIGHQEANTRVVATNLAREAVEVIHNIRDSNWLDKKSWENGLSDPVGGHIGVPVLDYFNNEWSIDYTAATFADEITKVYRFTSGSYNGLFIQQSLGPPVNSEITMFKRLVKLKSICYDNGAQTIEDSDSCFVGDKIGVRIVVEVRWQERGRPHDLTVEDSVYNWK